MTMNDQAKKILHHLEEAHKQDLETITQVLAQITRRTPKQIKPYLDAMLERLVELEERPFYETATPEEWSHALREWSNSHDLNTPLLSDEAVSRRGIYEED
jgi:hypothetical protein